jgi:hypothetical protein
MTQCVVNNQSETLVVRHKSHKMGYWMTIKDKQIKCIQVHNKMLCNATKICVQLKLRNKNVTWFMNELCSMDHFS